ncbi:MAG TPA: ABC transporter substrate-binding protein [Candidatus Limnocylindrales bacterium]|nr:ABC transporter substrate-binding protein [Candidatus Limnocylindrales bacterium]
MNRRDHAVVAVLVLVLVVLAGALALPRRAAAPPEEQPAPELTEPTRVVLREGIVGTADSVTPATARTRAERALVGLVFSGLVRLGPDTTYQPDLAASWTVDDTGKTWTFTLRDDAVWHDGAPVTADDVVFTVNALKSPEATGAGAGAWADVTVEAVDPLTVRFSLGTPIGGVLAAATQPLLPAHLLVDTPFADLATSDFARLPVGSGPFAMTDMDAGRAILVPASGVLPPVVEEPSASAEPFPSGDSLATPLPQSTPGLPTPYLDELEVRFYADEAALAAALASGEVDAASGLSGETLASVGADAGLDRSVYPTTTLTTVLLNLRPAHKELRDAKVRTALLAALDRDKLVADVLGGTGSRADTFVPPTSWAYDTASAGTVDYDRKAATKALQDAGWSKKSGQWHAPAGKKAYALEILTVPGSASPRLAAVAANVRDQWGAFGFATTLVEVKGAELAIRLRAGDFTAAVVDIAQGLEPDLYPLLATSQVRASGTNLAGYQDPTLDPLLEAARKPGTAEERAAAWKALLAGIAQRLPMLPLAWNDEVMLSRDLDGVTTRLIADTGDRYWDVLAWRLAADR